MEQKEEMNGINDPQISVIVPVYKVEPYLKRCIESIINQTYHNLEIILVDDGSPDRCPEMCDKWAQKDNRIRVIHKENGGLSDARNAGMRIANGEYIGFVDSDDWIEHDFIQILFDICEKQRVDIAECEWVRVSDSQKCKNTNERSMIKTYSSEEALQKNIMDQSFKQTVVNKLYRADIINGVFFPEHKTNEDEFWTYRVLGRATKLAHVDSVLYYYYQRQGSIINSEYSLKRLHGVEAKKLRMEYIKEVYPSLSDIATLSYIRACKYAYQKLCANSYLDGDDKIRRCLHQEFKKHYIVPKGSIKEMLWFNLFYLFPGFTSKIRNRFKIGL